MARFRKMSAAALQIALVAGLSFSLPAAGKSDGRQLVKAEDMKEMLTTLSSDEFEGRSTFTEGLGLAAAYVADHLKSWGVRPGGDNGSYLQRVRVIGVKSNNRSTITVEANGQTRTFKTGEAINLPSNVGGRRAFTSDQVEFLGYGLDAPGAKYNDFAGKDVKGKVVIFLGSAGPKSIDQIYQRLLRGRARYATDQKGAIATIGPSSMFRRGSTDPAARPGEEQAAAAPQSRTQPAPAAQPGQQSAGQPSRGGFGFFGPQIEQADFTTVQRLDSPVPPAVTASDEFFEFLFRGQEVSYTDLKAKAAERDPLPMFTLKDVRMTFNLDAEYRVVRTQYTRNVVGIVEGGDPRLKKTYVAFGAHFDHVGYSEGEVVQTSSGSRRAEPRGRVKDGALDDRYWNGADDDGSGTVAIMSIAKAFALGPKPRRSLLFVFHTGEEKGLYGSRYFADYPTVPLESIVAEINMDMVGRNRDDKAEEANTVYLIGSDRISTEFHNISIAANEAMPKPLKLDFEMNDPADLEQFYYRSDHYSYAAKGIPIVFMTTGLHADYHANTDSEDKINYEKMVRVGQLAYAIALRVGNMDHAPARDNRGARAGKGSAGRLTIDD